VGQTSTRRSPRSTGSPPPAARRRPPANPDDWAKIAGKKGERIVAIKPLTGQPVEKPRDVERVVATGQYL
jgi:hypothetical protein